MYRTPAVAVAVVLVLLGIVSFCLQDLRRPEPTCLATGAPPSGFVDNASGCPITAASYREVRRYESGLQGWRIAGLLLVVTGLGVGVGVVTAGSRRSGAAGAGAATGPAAETGAETL